LALILQDLQETCPVGAGCFGFPIKFLE